MPRARPLGSGLPQPAFSAASVSTRFSRSGLYGAGLSPS